MHDRNSLSGVALVVLVFVGVLPGVAFSQERGEAQANYLQTVGLDREALALEQALLERLQIRKPFIEATQQKGMARYFAFVMTVSGLDADKAVLLEEEGIDLIHAITANTRPFDEQVLLADLVIVGEVVAFTETPDPGDGFRSSIGVTVQTRLKGEVPADTVFIRQRSGLDADEAGEDASRDLFPEVGETYLFLLSNGMYRFFVASRDEQREPHSEAALARHFVIYRSYPMEDDRLLWNDFSRRDTRRAFKTIQQLDHLLAE